MEPAEKEKKRIDVLLAEYQACHRNRNHYDSVRWTIGSIFIAISLTLFGISFLKEVRGSFVEIFLIAIFSMLLMLIWYAYHQHVDPYVMSSVKRFHEIELELNKLGFDVKLHYSISKRSGRRGVLITLVLILVMLGAWSFRIAFFFEEMHLRVTTIIVYVFLALVTALIHTMLWVEDDWGNKIEKITKKRTTIKNENGTYPNRVCEMADLDEEQKEKLRDLYGHLSGLYSSSISHFLGLIGAWLVLVYTAKTSTIEPSLMLLIAIVLLIMVGFSWFRILNFTRLIYDLETQLGLVESKEKLKQFHIMKRPFSRKNIKILSTGEWAISLILLLFYASTFYWIFLT